MNKITHDFWGKNAKNIIEERLILEIKRLLIHTDKPIKEIGHLLGFSEATNFNKFLKNTLTKLRPVSELQIKIQKYHRTAFIDHLIKILLVDSNPDRANKLGT